MVLFAGTTFGHVSSIIFDSQFGSETDHAGIELPGDTYFATWVSSARLNLDHRLLLHFAEQTSYVYLAGDSNDLPVVGLVNGFDIVFTTKPIASLAKGGPNSLGTAVGKHGFCHATSNVVLV